MIYRRGIADRAPVWPAMGACACVAFAVASAAHGDQLVVRKTSFPGIKIVAFTQGKLHYRGPGGDLRRAELGDVDLIVAERGESFSDFNQAERHFAEGEWENAIVRYRRTLRLSSDFWTDVITARLVIACRKAGRHDEAVPYFIQLMRAPAQGPEVAAGLFPFVAGKLREEPFARALAQLDSAVQEVSDPSAGALLALARFDLLRAQGDPRAAAAARVVAALDLPQPLRLDGLFGLVFHALTDVLSSDSGAAALEHLDRAIRDGPRSSLPDFLLLKGRTLMKAAQSSEDVMRASWPFLRIVAHLPSDPRAAEALYETALAMDRLNRRDKALELVHECLAHPRASDAVRAAAEEKLAQWKTP